MGAVVGARLIDMPEARSALLGAIASVPPGFRLGIPQLRDALLCQGDVLRALQELVDAGALDRATLRPPIAERRSPPRLPRQRGGDSAARRLPGGASHELATDLLQEVDVFLAKSGMAPSRLGYNALRDFAVVTRLRHGKAITPSVAERMRSYMAGWSPPPPRPAETEPVECGGCAPPVYVEKTPRRARAPSQASADEEKWPSSFDEQLARVERGEVGIGPNLKFGRPDPGGTLGGVTGEINL